MQIPTQRLTGIVAGVFAVRTFDRSMSALTMLAISVGDGEFTDHLMGAAPALIGTVVNGLICWIYLKKQQARWQHIITIIILCLDILFSCIAIVSTFAVSATTASLAKTGTMGSMIARAVVQIIFSAIVIWVVAVLLKRKKVAYQQDPTRMDDCSAI